MKRCPVAPSHPRCRPACRAGALASVLGIAMLAIAWPACAEDGKLAPIEIELPEPYFGGTPLDYFGPNLEKPNYKPRPPFMAPAATVNVALDKSVSASEPEPRFGELDFLVDGDKHYKKSSLLGLGADLQWIQVDLEEPSNIYAIVLWHFHEGERVYFDVSIRAADDEEFTQNVQVIFNNDHDNSAGLGVGEAKEYIESYKGKFIDAKGITARYVRFYTKGNTTDDLAHYVEAEIFGKPVD